MRAQIGAARPILVVRLTSARKQNVLFHWSCRRGVEERGDQQKEQHEKESVKELRVKETMIGRL